MKLKRFFETNLKFVKQKKKDIYIALGLTASGRLLFVVFENLGKGVAGVITARDMTKKEIKIFRRK